MTSTLDSILRAAPLGFLALVSVGSVRAGEGLLPVVAVQTAAEERALAKRYPEYRKLAARRPILPGLDSGYVPQGVAFVPGRNLAIVTHYFKEEAGLHAAVSWLNPLAALAARREEKPGSLLSVLSLETGRVTRVVRLFEESAGGKRTAYDGHAGGAAVLNGRVWVSSSGKLLGFPLKEVLGDGRQGSAVADRVIPVDANGSYVSATPAHSTLWVGDYRRPGDARFSTPAHHRHGKLFAWIAAYRMDPRTGRPEASVRYEAQGRRVPRPDRVLFVRDGVQGMAFCGDRIVLSVSGGAADGKLEIHASPTGGKPLTVRLPGGATTVGYELNDSTLEKTLPCPSGCEDLEWTGDRVLLTFEGAAKAYRDRWRRAGALAEDRLAALELPRRR